MKELLLIFNPIAGKKKAMQKKTEITELFRQAGYRVSTCITAHRGDARKAVKKFGKGKNLIVCCGGDGTLNEVICGLMQAKLQLPIGYIPTGSTNDFATSIGLSSDILTATRQIISGTDWEYDLGRFDNRYFNYVASFGAFTAASYGCPQMAKNLLGHFAYILRAAGELPTLHTEHVCINLDGQFIEGDYLFGAVCNTTSVAGVVTLKPDQVDMQDGKFEVILVRAPKSPAELVHCIQALLSHSLNSEMITLLCGSNLEITAPAHMNWSLDGEKAVGREHIRIENLHRRLWIRH